jgi:hypothetical protein
MQTELRNFSYHLGSHDFGVEGQLGAFHGHLLSKAELGVQGLQLPFIQIAAKNQEAADNFAKMVNKMAVRYNIDPYDIASLVASADKLTG